ncbi:hypothetical protein BLOT_008781 [Blomia tropicalis]|nr:hypothetical protein BLOT_008781 [Blomia tropicalis]
MRIPKQFLELENFGVNLVKFSGLFMNQVSVQNCIFPQGKFVDLYDNDPEINQRTITNETRVKLDILNAFSGPIFTIMICNDSDHDPSVVGEHSIIQFSLI